MRASSDPQSRPGKALVLMAALLPFLIGAVALSVDNGVVAVARGQLQTATDAAALAGALQLATENRLRGDLLLIAELDAARSKAISFGKSNPLLGKPPVLVDNPYNLIEGDIVVGYLPTSDLASLLPDTLASRQLFNSVRVTSGGSATTNVVPSFFGRMLGNDGSSLRNVASTATVQNFKIGGFKQDEPNRPHMLPIVLDETTYELMLAGATTDQYTYNSATNTVTAGADGVEESKLYPVGNGNPGNWGTIDIGVSNNSTSILGDQIRNGLTAAQLATYPNGTIALDEALTPPSITFSGNPGISAGIKDDLISIIGRPVVIPIYDVTGGNGNNATYRVVDFAGVRILSVNFQGNPKYVIIQPALVREPTAIPGEAQASWTAGGLVRLFLSR